MESLNKFRVIMFNLNNRISGEVLVYFSDLPLKTINLRRALSDMTATIAL